MFMKQDVFSLLYVYHEDNEESVESLKEFEKTEKKLRGYAHFLTIGCHKDEFQNEMTPMCQQEADSGIFPLISGFVPPSNRYNPYTKKIEDNQETPYGNRPKKEKNFSKFILSHLPNFVSPIAKGKEYDTKMKSNKKINKVVLFSEKSISPGLYKALASKFKDRIEFYFINASKMKKKVKKLGIDSFPTIIVHANVDPDGENLSTQSIETYDGENDILELTEFLTPFALNEKYDPSAGDKPQYQRRGKYTFVNHKNYSRGFMEDYRAQVVFFSKDYDSVKEKFEYVAEALHGPANVVYFNCESEQSQKIADKLGIKKYPRILVFSTGAEKDKESALEISLSTRAEDIQNIVEGTEIKDNLREVSDSVISSLILTNAVQLRKITLVYLYEEENDDVPLSYKSMSTNPIFKEHFEFVALKEPSQVTMQQFQVPKLPVIIGGIPPPEDADPESPEAQGGIRSMVYQGEINDYFELLDFNIGVLQSFFPDSDEGMNSQQRSPEAIVDFQEATASNFDEICESKKGF